MLKKWLDWDLVPVVLVPIVCWWLSWSWSWFFISMLVVLFWRSFPFVYHARMFAYMTYAFVFSPPLSRWNEPSFQVFRAWPDWCDWNNHMGNSSYSVLCDFARYTHLARLYKKSVAGANGGVIVRFKRSFLPMERIIVETRVRCYSSPWMLVECKMRDVDSNRCKVVQLCKVHVEPPDMMMSNQVILNDQNHQNAQHLLNAWLEQEKHYGKDTME